MPVIAHEDDDGVLRQTPSLDGCNHTAHGVIEHMNAGGVLPASRILDVRHRPQAGNGGLNGVVGLVVRQVKEERTVVVAVDELCRLARHKIGEVGAVLVVLGVVPPQSVADAGSPVVAVRIVVDGAHLETDELVEALGPRADLGRHAEVPLAEDCRAVAATVQKFGQGRLVRLHSQVALDDAGMLAAGEQTGARRGADRRRHVVVGEAHAVCRQRVEVGCAQVDGAVTAQVGAAQVVGDDEDDVRRAHGQRLSSCAGSA